MEKIVVQGGDNRLVGSVTIEGAKNAVLPLLAATILASKGKTVLQNVPILSDVFTMNQVVRGLNAKVDFDEEAHVVEVDATGDITEEAPYKYVSKMRASMPKFLCQGGAPSGVVRSTSTSKVWKLWGQKSLRQLVTSKPRQTTCMALISTWTSLVSVRHKTS